MQLSEKIENIKIAKNDKWTLNQPVKFAERSFIGKAVERNLNPRSYHSQSHLLSHKSSLPDLNTRSNSVAKQLGV